MRPTLKAASDDQAVVVAHCSIGDEQKPPPHDPYNETEGNPAE